MNARADLIAGDAATKANPSILKAKTVGQFLTWPHTKTGELARQYKTHIMGKQGFSVIAAIILSAFGIALPLPSFVSGMVVALGCCFAVMAARPLEKRQAVTLTLLMGTLAGIIAAMLHGTTGEVWLWGRLPVQSQMGLAGATQAVFEFVAARGRPALDDLAKRAGLPGPEGELSAIPFALTASVLHRTGPSRWNG